MPTKTLNAFATVFEMTGTSACLGFYARRVYHGRPQPGAESNCEIEKLIISSDTDRQPRIAYRAQYSPPVGTAGRRVTQFDRAGTKRGGSSRGTHRVGITGTPCRYRIETVASIA